MYIFYVSLGLFNLVLLLLCWV